MTGPLSDQAFVALDGLSRREPFTDPGELVFCTVVGERLQDAAIREAFYSALDAAELGHLREKADDPIIPYDLRHTFGSLAVRTAPLSDVQAWMGHQHVSTTMRYVHYRPQDEGADLLGHRFTGTAGELEALLGDSAEARIGIPPCATDDDLMRRETTQSASS